MPRQDRSHKPRHEADGGAQCGKSACCVRRGGDWKRGTVEIVGHSQTKGRDNGEPKLRPKPARQSSTLLIGGLRERSSRQGRSLAGCKSPYRQLPVVGRLAYPMPGEVTNRVLLGRKSPGCPAGVFAAVGTIWGASKLGGRNITKCLQPRKSPRTKSFQAG